MPTHIIDGRWVITSPEFFSSHHPTAFQEWMSIIRNYLDNPVGDLNLPHGWNVTSLVTPLSKQLEKLLWLLSLSIDERAFILAASEQPNDDLTLRAFTDWLKEQRRDSDAELVEKVLEK